jgi:stearoyl-CoA desaturase (delta-9 desaturase)
VETTAESDHRINWPGSIPFFGLHVGAIVGIALLGWSWKGFALAVGLYVVRMFFVTAGYHRYFAHRTFRTSRAMQLVFALGAMSSSQKGVVWWASHHRKHHKHSDLPGDVHSALRDGFWWSHLGWVLAYDTQTTDLQRVRDLTEYPELVWLNRRWWLPPATLGVGSFLVGGWFGLVWAFCLSTVLLWHGTFTINSLTHVFGTRRYLTSDNSRNSALLAIVTLGEGWHNNHHYYQRSVRQGFLWWEFDPTFYVLRGLAALGLVWDLHEPPREVVRKRLAGKLPAAGVVNAAVPTLATLPGSPR